MMIITLDAVTPDDRACASFAGLTLVVSVRAAA